MFFHRPEHGKTKELTHVKNPPTRSLALALTLTASLSVTPALRAGTWPFLPERDTFRADARFDLRGLNEKVAGQGGFVRLSPDGESFVLGDGTPVRFWGVTTYVQRDRPAEDLAHHARFLAKRGVNMVRLHGHMEPKDKDAKLTEPDRKVIEEAWKLVAAMKKEGIYTTLSPYWAANIKHVPASWGIEGWPENESPQGLLFFNPRMQKETYSGKQVVDTGRMPWAIADTAITLTVSNLGLRAATQLDINGNPRRKLKVATEGRSLRLTMPRDALYVVLGAK
jgi:hypothetical protein